MGQRGDGVSGEDGYGFEEQVEVERQYDHITIPLLRKRYGPKGLIHIADFRGTPLDVLGIDFGLYFRDGKSITVDAKIDRYTTGRTLFEHTSNSETGRLGWAADRGRLNSHFLFVYVNENPPRGLFFTRAEVLDLWSAHGGRWMRTAFESKTPQKGRSHFTLGRCIERRDLEASLLRNHETVLGETDAETD